MKADLTKERFFSLFHFVCPAGVLQTAADGTDIMSPGASHCNPLLLGCGATFNDLGLVQDTLGYLVGLASPVCQDLLAQ